MANLIGYFCPVPESEGVLGSALGRDWSHETEVTEILDRSGLDMTRVQPLDEVLSDGGISCENVSWR